MKRLLAALCAVLSFAAPVAAADARPPQRIEAEYQISMAGMRIGRVSERFAREGDTYSIESVTRSEGALKLFLDDTVTLRSTGAIGPGGLKPAHFDQRQAKEPKRDIDATFDWKRGLLVSTFGGKTREIELPGETQDRLSLMYQFMNLSPDQASMKVSMSNGRKVESYAYRFVEQARITTPAGEFETLHYARVTDNAKESHADVWLAKDRFNFPVRVVFDDPRGLRLEQSLVSLQAQ